MSDPVASVTDAAGGAGGPPQLLKARRDRCRLDNLLFALGPRVPGVRTLRGFAGKHLQDLAAAVRETVVLAFPGYDDVAFVEKHFGPSIGRFSNTPSCADRSRCSPSATSCSARRRGHADSTAVARRGPTG
jgi:hypothetical protein